MLQTDVVAFHNSEGADMADMSSRRSVVGQLWCFDETETLATTPYIPGHRARRRYYRFIP